MFFKAYVVSSLYFHQYFVQNRFEQDYKKYTVMLENVDEVIVVKDRLILSE